MADQPPVRPRTIQRLTRHTSKRRPADRQHTPVNLVTHVNLTPVVGRSPLATPCDLGHEPPLGPQGAWLATPCVLAHAPTPGKSSPTADETSEPAAMERHATTAKMFSDQKARHHFARQVQSAPLPLAPGASPVGQREPSGTQRRRRSRRCIPAAETGDKGRPNGSMNSAQGPVVAGTVPSRSLML